jgi:hypothetical protein
MQLRELREYISGRDWKAGGEYVLPMHGSGKEMGEGLADRIKKDLDLK